MKFTGKIKGGVKKFDSKRAEKGDIKRLEAEVKEESRNIDEATVSIGEFYWNQYVDGKFLPMPESQELFDSIKDSLVRLDEINAEIEERRSKGEVERETIDEEIARQEAERERLAEERAKERAEERLRQAEERARMREEQQSRIRDESRSIRSEDDDEL